MYITLWQFILGKTNNVIFMLRTFRESAWLTNRILLPWQYNLLPSANKIQFPRARARSYKSYTMRISWIKNKSFLREIFLFSSTTPPPPSLRAPKHSHILQKFRYIISSFSFSYEFFREKNIISTFSKYKLFWIY